MGSKSMGPQLTLQKGRNVSLRQLISFFPLGSMMSSSCVLRCWRISAWKLCYLLVFFFLINLFFWRLITLQYCIGFAIYQHKSAIGIHVFPILNPPPSPYHPSGSSQCTSPKHPVLCIEPRLATRFIYDIIHVSMPFSQTIPLSPSPTESKRLFYIHLCLFCCLAYRVIDTIFLNSIYMRYYTVLVFFFLAYFILYNRLLDLPN